MGGIQKMTQDDKGGVGVPNGKKKDDVIYEQPLTWHKHLLESSTLALLLYVSSFEFINKKNLCFPPLNST